MTESTTNEQDALHINIAEFAGTPYSEKKNLQVSVIDTSKAEEQNKEDMRISARAKEIYESGNALNEMEALCHLFHVDDDNIIRALILSFACTKVKNNELGLNINICGEAGSGKTHVADTVFDIIPDEYKLGGRFSDKAILYAAADIKPGSVIYSDDQALSETAADIMKAQTSDINKPFVYLTVIKGVAQKFIFPERCVRWFVKCDSYGDEQTADRELLFYADNSREHQQRVIQLKNEGAKNPLKEMDKTPKEICRRIWSYITSGNIVSIPFSDRIKTDSAEALRNRALFLTMIRASAVLAAPKRNKTADDVIEANEEDFKTSANIMNPIIAGKGGSQKLKLTPTQTKILDYLRTIPSGVYAPKEIKTALKLPKSSFSEALNGKANDESKGLLKLPGIDTVFGGYYGKEKFIDWNKELFLSWEGSTAFFVLDKFE